MLWLLQFELLVKLHEPRLLLLSLFLSITNPPDPLLDAGSLLFPLLMSVAHGRLLQTFLFVLQPSQVALELYPPFLLFLLQLFEVNPNGCFFVRVPPVVQHHFLCLLLVVLNQAHKILLNLL